MSIPSGLRDFLSSGELTADSFLSGRGARFAETLITIDEQLPAIGCCSKISSTVCVCSTALRKRNHQERNSTRALCRNVTEIEDNHPESLALQQQVGDFKHLRQLRFPAAKAGNFFIG